jgi:hypothetical protein
MAECDDEWRNPTQLYCKHSAVSIEVKYILSIGKITFADNAYQASSLRRIVFIKSL